MMLMMLMIHYCGNFLCYLHLPSQIAIISGHNQNINYHNITSQFRSSQSNYRRSCLQLLHQTIRSTMKKKFLSKPTLVAIAVVASIIILPSSALLFSPLLLKATPWGITGTRAAYHRSEKTVKVSFPDFSHDDDLMRYKHELLADIYEKSLHRGFVGGQGQ